MSNKVKCGYIVFISALPIENWNVTVGNTSSTRITIHWQNLAPLIRERVVHYIALIRNISGILVNGVVVSEKATFANFSGLSPYVEYQVSVIGANSNGQSHKSSNVTAWTDEGGNYNFFIILCHQ